MATHLPTDFHDFTLWLLKHLEGVSPVDGSSLWEGVLPQGIDFTNVERHLEAMPNGLAGVCREDIRCIGFYPTYANVYSNIEQLLGTSKNRTRIPDRFTLRDASFTYPSAEEPPPIVVAKYMDAVTLWTVLESLADVRNGSILFVTSHDSQLTILPEFSHDDLRQLSSLTRFVTEFMNEESHTDQKRSIIRSVLIEQFRPQRTVMMRDVLAKFESIATDARHSLAMYMSEFSVAKVRAEVERQNLDDSLNLNKTLSDIQNQLLALPAAILLAGATIQPSESLRNYAILFGIIIFTIFVFLLVSNQRHAIDSIAEQIKNRKNKIESMPQDSSSEILPLFDVLNTRISRQRKTLTLIRYVVLSVLILTAAAVIEVNHNGVVSQNLKQRFSSLIERVNQIDINPHNPPAL